MLTELVVTECSFFYRWVLPSGDCYGVISLWATQGMLLFNISFRIFCMSSCMSGKEDDTLKEVQTYNVILTITTPQIVCD